MLAYVLNKEISGQKILQDIESSIKKFKQHNSNTIPILYIDIRNLTSDDTSLIPKLEYKNPEADCPT